MHEVEERPRLHLGLGPPQRLRPRRVQADEVAVEVGDAEQVRGRLPDLVALRRPGGDLPRELDLRLLARGHVLDERVEAVDATFRGSARQVADLGDAGPPVAARPVELEGDRLARQGTVDERLAGGVGIGPEQIPDVPTDDFGGRHGKPVVVGTIGETVDVVRADEGNQDRQRVRDEAEFAFAFLGAPLDHLPLGDVGEEDRDPLRSRFPGAQGPNVEPAPEHVRVMLEMGGLARQGDATVGVEPVALQVGRELADPLAGDVGTGLAHEGGVRLHDAVVDGAGTFELHLDDAEPDLDALEQGPVARLVLLEESLRRGALGDVVPLHEDAAHRTVRVGDGLVHEVEVAFVDRTAGRRLHVEPGGRRLVRPSRAEDLVEQLDVALGGGVGKRLGYRAADHVAMVDGSLVGGVRQVEAMLRAAEERDEARSLLEHLRERGGLGAQEAHLGLELLARQRLRVGLRCSTHELRTRSQTQERATRSGRPMRVAMVNG